MREVAGGGGIESLHKAAAFELNQTRQGRVVYLEAQGIGGRGAGRMRLSQQEGPGHEGPGYHSKV